MELTDNLMAFVERKLFTLNTGHYYNRLPRENWRAIRRFATRSRRNSCRHAGRDGRSGAVLIKRYAFDPQEARPYPEILGRFENPYLKRDDVERVGRQPLRKLSAGDRLIKPLLGTLEYGLPHLIW